MKVWTFERQQRIARPRGEVFAFFEDATNLGRITPPFLDFRILTEAPIEMQVGTLIDYRISLLGVPLRWRTRIEVYEPLVRFVDVQLSGPYRRWRHTHEFSEVPGGTLMVDRVEYALGFGAMGHAARALFVQRTLRKIFDHRRDAVAGIFAPESVGRGDAHHPGKEQPWLA